MLIGTFFVYWFFWRDIADITADIGVSGGNDYKEVIKAEPDVPKVEPEVGKDEDNAEKEESA